MAKERKTLSAAVEVDSDLANEYDEFVEKNNMQSTSEAVRYLLRTGLEAEAEPEEAPKTIEQEVRQAASGKALDWGIFTAVVAILALLVPMQWVAIPAIALSLLGSILALAGLWFDVKHTLFPGASGSPEVQEVSD